MVGAGRCQSPCDEQCISDFAPPRLVCKFFGAGPRRKRLNFGAHCVCKRRDGTTKGFVRLMYREKNFAERRAAAIEAKKAVLEKFKSKPAADDPAVLARQAERKAILEAREKRNAEKERLRQEKLAREAAERAEREAAEAAARAIAEEKAKAEAKIREAEELERLARELTEEAERKAKRDARYAARKSRSKGRFG